MPLSGADARGLRARRPGCEHAGVRRALRIAMVVGLTTGTAAADERPGPALPARDPAGVPGPAPDPDLTAPGMPSPRRERALVLGLRYRRATDFDGGTIELAVRRPMAARWWAEAAIGLQLGTLDRRRSITLTNPRLGAGLVLGPRLIATVDLALPAASATGDDGAFAAAHTALAVVDPAPLSPRTTSIAVAVSPRWTAGKAFAQLRLGGALLLPSDGGSRLLLAVDVGGGIAVAGPVHLAATLATTSYVLADVTGDDFVHRLTLAAQVATHGVELTAGVAAPLDRHERERDLVELVLTARTRF